MEQIVDKVTAIRACAKRLRLSCLMTNATEVLMQAQKESPSYDDLLLTVLEAEVKSREEKQLLQRMKAARLPLSHDLDKYDFSNPNGLTPTQLNQLRELHWVEEGYNLMLAGPLNRFQLALGHFSLLLGVPSSVSQGCSLSHFCTCLVIRSAAMRSSCLPRLKRSCHFQSPSISFTTASSW